MSRPTATWAGGSQFDLLQQGRAELGDLETPNALPPKVVHVHKIGDPALTLVAWVLRLVA